MTCTLILIPLWMDLQFGSVFQQLNNTWQKHPAEHSHAAIKAASKTLRKNSKTLRRPRNKSQPRYHTLVTGMTNQDSPMKQKTVRKQKIQFSVYFQLLQIDLAIPQTSFFFFFKYKKHLQQPPASRPEILPEKIIEILFHTWALASELKPTGFKYK